MSATTLSPTWQTYDAESDVTGKFGPSLVARARKRTVIQPGPMAHNQFVVVGDPKLGDAYEDYRIQFNGRTYRCSCRDHAYGDRRNLCSHVLAVILYRKNNRAAAAAAGAELTEHPAGGAGESEGDEVPGPATQNTSTTPHDDLDESIAGNVLLPDPADPMFGEPPLPEWVREIREHQWNAVQEVVAAFERGDRVVFVDAPTGSGKTLLAELVRRILKTRALYVCSTKSLQEQAAVDFPYAKVLKGRANYPTADDPDAFGDVDRWGNARLTAADCTRQMADLPACAKCPPVERSAMHCANCHPVTACPYSIAKSDALAADLTILNTSYFLSECNGPGKFSAAVDKESGFGLVIVDEADLLENELMGQVEVRVTESMRKKYAIEPPAKKTVEASWAEWVSGEAIPKVALALKKTPARSSDVTVIRERQRLERLAARLKVLEDGLGNGNWVADDWERQGSIVFRPVKVDGFGLGMLWRHGARFLCMSATILSPDLMAEMLGVGA